mmetsp:Transcript_1846/g.5564  ORF Transcript_1846/g.5564 Transcript_1846/m.5564 type:complete len:200 (+) Transcript_1846:190-789(+)
MTSMSCDGRKPSICTARSTEYSSTTVAELETMHERAEVQRKRMARKTTGGTDAESRVRPAASRAETWVTSSAAPRPKEAAMVMSTRKAIEFHACSTERQPAPTSSAERERVSGSSGTRLVADRSSSSSSEALATARCSGPPSAAALPCTSQTRDAGTSERSAKALVLRWTSRKRVETSSKRQSPLHANTRRRRLRPRAA